MMDHISILRRVSGLLLIGGMAFCEAGAQTNVAITVDAQLNRTCDQSEHLRDGVCDDGATERI